MPLSVGAISVVELAADESVVLYGQQATGFSHCFLYVFYMLTYALPVILMRHANVMLAHTLSFDFIVIIIYLLNQHQTAMYSNAIYTVSQKNDNDVAHYNFNAH